MVRVPTDGWVVWWAGVGDGEGDQDGHQVHQFAGWPGVQILWEGREQPGPAVWSQEQAEAALKVQESLVGAVASTLVTVEKLAANLQKVQQGYTESQEAMDRDDTHGAHGCPDWPRVHWSTLAAVVFNKVRLARRNPILEIIDNQQKGLKDTPKRRTDSQGSVVLFVPAISKEERRGGGRWRHDSRDKMEQLRGREAEANQLRH